MTNTALEILSPTCHKVWVGRVTILFSYKQPIAVWVRVPGGIDRFAVKQLPRDSSQRHLTRYMDMTLRPGDKPVIRVNAEEMDAIICQNAGGEPRPLAPWAETE